MPDRGYRNLELASTTRVMTAWGASRLTMAYMDHPFGADQFYGNYNSWENTKTWFAGVQQSFGERTSANFAYRRHSDLFGEDVRAAITADASVRARKTPQSTGPAAVAAALADLKGWLGS